MYIVFEVGRKTKARDRESKSFGDTLRESLGSRQQQFQKAIEQRVDELLRDSLDVTNSTKDVLLSDLPRVASQQYSTLADKEPFFRHVVVDAPGHLIWLLEEYTNTPGLLFRGVSRARYRLYSSLQRALLEQPKLPGKTYADLWKLLIRGFREADDGLFLRYLRHQGISDITDLGILAFLQHHGCPSPLLDWTYHLGKGLFFMVSGRKGLCEGTEPLLIDNYVSLYAMRAGAADMLGVKREIEHLFSAVADAQHGVMGEMLGRHELLKDAVENLDAEYGGFSKEEILNGVSEVLRDRSRADYFRSRVHHILDVDLLTSREVTFVSDKDDMPDLALRLYNNLNLVNQDGAFFLNANPVLPLEEVLDGVKLQSSDGSKEKLFTCLDINVRLLPLVFKELEVGKVTNSRVFPDPYAISQAIGVSILEKARPIRTMTDDRSLDSTGWEKLAEEGFENQKGELLRLSEASENAKNKEELTEYLADMMNGTERLERIVKWRERMMLPDESPERGVARAKSPP